MDEDEKRFWHRLDLWGNLWITVLSIGILGILDEKYLPGSILAVGGFCGVIYVSQREKNTEGTIRYIAMAMLVLTWVFVGYDIYDRHYAVIPPYSFNQAEWNKPLTQVWDKTFVREKVPLDGFEYINCTFTDVVFIYEGRSGGRLTNSQITSPGSASFGSHNPVVQQAMSIANTLEQLEGIKNPLKCAPDSDLLIMPPK